MIKQIQELEDSLKSEDDMVTMARSQEDCKTRMTVPLTDSELRILKLNPISGDLAPGLQMLIFYYDEIISLSLSFDVLMSAEE